MTNESADPFERAVMRESRMRGWAEMMSTREGCVQYLTKWLLALGLGWSVLLAGHWLLLADPRWLVVAHTVGFALTASYSLACLVFLKKTLKRMPREL